MNKSEQLVHDFMCRVKKDDLYYAVVDTHQVEDSPNVLREFTLVRLIQQVDGPQNTPTNTIAYVTKNEIISTGGNTNE